MNALSVTNLKALPNYKWTEERQILEVEVERNMNFAIILMKEDTPASKEKNPHHLVGYDTNWGVIFQKINYYLSLENKSKEKSYNTGQTSKMEEKGIWKRIAKLTGYSVGQTF